MIKFVTGNFVFSFYWLIAFVRFNSRSSLWVLSKKIQLYGITFFYSSRILLVLLPFFKMSLSVFYYRLSTAICQFEQTLVSGFGYGNVFSNVLSFVSNIQQIPYNKHFFLTWVFLILHRFSKFNQMLILVFIFAEFVIHINIINPRFI